MATEMLLCNVILKYRIFYLFLIKKIQIYLLVCKRTLNAIFHQQNVYNFSTLFQNIQFKLPKVKYFFNIFS